MRKLIDLPKPGSTARDLSIILAARRCFNVNAMYLRCSAPSFREIYAFPHSTFDDDPVNSNIWSLALFQSSLSRHEFLGDKGSKASLIFSIGTDIQSRTSPPRSRAVFALSNDVSHMFIGHSEVT